ncbi:ATP-dependent RNA helicase DDX51-like [Halichondria panicea]|uniref:ATP-dependent RNA helicase DDX51-like n=1 Tax=Halichondria panicea TaxID=6063 RepID=UPI00312B3AA7
MMSRAEVEGSSVPGQGVAWTKHLIEQDILTHSRALMELPLALLKNLGRIGVDSCFPVQAHVIPEVLSSTHSPLLMCVGGEIPPDIMVCAPTGCGKTLAYVVPIVAALMTRVVPQVRALVVVPSQELASQVHQVFLSLTHGTQLKAGLLSEEATLIDPTYYPLASSMDILITTPVQLTHYIDRGSLPCLRYLVLDEADRLLQASQCQWLPKLMASRTSHTSPLSTTLHTLSSLPHVHDPLHPLMVQPVKQVCVQKLLFSATMTFDPEHLSVLRLNRPLLFCVSDADSAFTLPTRLEEVLVKCGVGKKPLVLLHLLSQSPAALCFTNTRDTAHRLVLLLRELGLVTVAEMTGAISSSKRREVLEDFRRGRTKVLVCTDAMARGMDLPNINTVINYDPPRTFGMYLHRAGRTARAGQRGVVNTLLSPDEVHPFKTMLRKVVKKTISNITVSQDDLRPYDEQYRIALDKLQSNTLQ